MEFEAATFNAWTRKRYLEQGRKHSYFIYDYIPLREQYIDTLMRDLGLNPFHKSSVFEEWFVRYKPSDYRTILDEYRSIRRHQLETRPLNRHAKASGQGTAEANGHSAWPN
ncbi:uncharacterized protein GLRG_07370 [Colletotrichum graminicola M1.001]|uniref:Uncharacterized protein n=1 Tax=Colletotrichum graminicola (strain M1.001 / M2 / FGSC 10212) TaxID=645133 RepID=E3QMY8_COLGM|nr:uncharacterized protein GLRG_07370 [Colletotrichum graminicola M1.001]EFQ32226.1 hypothetical protein GLRG_07370 [Colletotrichum graminicola M1.001]